jgi:PleD family two-component response regulator
MYDAALRDPLTKSFNKKYFFDRLAIEATYAKRHQHAGALNDVDFFKRVNDTRVTSPATPCSSRSRRSLR